MPSAIGAKDFTLIVSYMRYIFLIVMTANPLQDHVLVLLVRVAEVPIPRSPVAFAAVPFGKARNVAAMIRA